MKDYIEQANLTASGNFHAGVDKEDFLADLQEAISALQQLDRYKKFFFYGKKPDPAYMTFTDCAECSVRDIPPILDKYDHKGRNLLHGILGMATEAGELLEALQTSIKNKTPMDAVNVSEEIGDSFWYAAMLLRVAGKDFASVQEQNIAKLRARFPNNFTEYDANHRDLAAERKILEDKN
mgnify:FL=1|jgi:NTP pyrophosphatase (non-canonical NTP hydrolase)